MNTLLMKQFQISQIGKNPVVVLPVSAWEVLRTRFEELEEYYQMSVSKKYKKDITNARISKKEISSKDLYKRLNLV